MLVSYVCIHVVIFHYKCWQWRIRLVRCDIHLARVHGITSYAAVSFSQWTNNFMPPSKSAPHLSRKHNRVIFCVLGESQLASWLGGWLGGWLAVCLVLTIWRCICNRMRTSKSHKLLYDGIAWIWQRVKLNGAEKNFSLGTCGHGVKKLVAATAAQCIIRKQQKSFRSYYTPHHLRSRHFTRWPLSSAIWKKK